MTSQHQTDKQACRKAMAALKNSFSIAERAALSAKATQRLETLPLFQQARTIALYYALPDEVQTAELIDRWCATKNILLPIVDGNELLLRLYKGREQLQTGSLGVLEPSADGETMPPELIIVPGVAFDRQLNRLGRGKGYYDRLLADVSLPCIGLCYHFQLLDNVPTDPHDRRMSMIVTDRETVTPDASDC